MSFIKEIMRKVERTDLDADTKEAIRRFMLGEKPRASSDITESVSYGYEGPDANGFFKYQLPVQFVEAARKRQGQKSVRDVLVRLKDMNDYWSQTKQWKGAEIETAHIYRVPWSKDKQIAALLELPSGWVREFCPAKDLYVVDYDPVHVYAYKSLPDALIEMGLMTEHEITHRLDKYVQKNTGNKRAGQAMIAAVEFGKDQKLLILFMALEFAFTGDIPKQRPDQLIFDSKKITDRKRKKIMRREPPR